MKTLIYALIFIVFVICITLATLIYRQQQSYIVVPDQPTIKTATSTAPEISLAKKMLVANLDTSGMSAEERTAIDTSINNQLDENRKLLVIANAAGTIVSSSTIRQAWQREIYKYGSEDGWRTYIESLGVSEAEYKTQLEEQLRITTFLETEAAKRMTEDDVRKYFNSLSVDERGTFAEMEPEIQETVLTQYSIQIRSELLTTN